MNDQQRKVLESWRGTDGCVSAALDEIDKLIAEVERISKFKDCQACVDRTATRCAEIAEGIKDLQPTRARWACCRSIEKAIRKEFNL